jgi:hypothetical protein
MKKLSRVTAELQQEQTASQGPVLSLRPKWILVALVLVNGSGVFVASNRLLTWPSSVHLFFSAEQVQVYHDTAGNEDYSVEVPVKEFPYEVQLNQHFRFDLLWLSLFNLLLLGLLLHSNWRESRLKLEHDQH